MLNVVWDVVLINLGQVFLVGGGLWVLVLDDLVIVRFTDPIIDAVLILVDGKYLEVVG